MKTHVKISQRAATFNRYFNNYYFSILVIICLQLFAHAQQEEIPSSQIFPTDAYELMHLGRERTLHNDYMGAVEFYCEALFANNHNAVHAAVTNMRQYFMDGDTALIKNALAVFRECALTPRDEIVIDTAVIRDFLASIYGRRALFDLEIATLVELDIEESSPAIKLADLAKNHLANRRYRHAANAAVASHGKLPEGGRKQDAATAAHRAYMFLGMRDSALVWLRQSGATTRDAQILSAVLYQETGHFEEARALIDSLIPSFVKDTLLIRQLIFEGNLQEAIDFLLTTKLPRWHINSNERRLWTARTMNFAGRGADAATIIDSIDVSAQWHGAQEVLRNKYRSRIFFEDAILSAFGKLEYFIYIGDLTSAARVFMGYETTGVAGEAMAIRVARQLIIAQRFEEAHEVLSAINKSDNLDDRSAEYLYFLAETLSKTGRGDEARGIVNKLLTKYPSDIFTQKARVLLLHI